MNNVDELNDDGPQGRILSRREVLSLILGGGAALVLGAGSAKAAAATNVLKTLGAGSTAATSAAAVGSSSVAAALLAAAALDCVVRPEKTEGPYYVEEDLNRADIRIDSADGSVAAGAGLTLNFLVSQVGSSSCAPLEGAQVEVWHCDALGVYSDVNDPGYNTAGTTFCTATSTPARTAPRRERRSIPAGIPAVPSTFTLRCAPIRARAAGASSPRNSFSTIA